MDISFIVETLPRKVSDHDAKGGYVITIMIKQQGQDDMMDIDFIVQTLPRKVSDQD
jgi:hypothetical protein